MNKQSLNTPTGYDPAATAEALAAQFQVAELEPRLENVWGDPVETPEPTVPLPGKN